MAITTVSIDIGLSGGVAIFTDTAIHVTAMPVRTIVDKPAVTVFAKDKKGNKVVIKSGSNKGKHRRVIKTAAKTHRELDCRAIHTIMLSADRLLIESPAMSIGNSAKSSATTNRNFGKLLAIAELCELDITIIQPQTWKTALGLGRDKKVAIAYAERLLTNTSLQVNQSNFKASEDGLAEAICIAYYFDKELLSLNKS